MEHENTNFNNADTKPLDNKTYIECHDNHEENTDERTNQFIDLWKTTNFWLSIIGLYFLSKIVILIVKVIIAIQLGQNILNALT